MSCCPAVSSAHALSRPGRHHGHQARSGGHVGWGGTRLREAGLAHARPARRREGRGGRGGRAPAGGPRRGRLRRARAGPRSRRARARLHPQRPARRRSVVTTQHGRRAHRAGPYRISVTWHTRDNALTGAQSRLHAQVTDASGRSAVRPRTPGASSKRGGGADASALPLRVVRAAVAGSRAARRVVRSAVAGAAAAWQQPVASAS